MYFKKPSKLVLMMQALYTLLCGVNAYNCITQLLSGNNSILTILNDVIYLVVYFFIIFYAVKNYKNDDKHFKYIVYAYAALLGINILYSGQMMDGFGLSQNVTLLINICNLCAFGLVIKFAEILDDRKKALISMALANLIKLCGEVYVIILMFDYIQLIHIFISLSVPVLGITILVAYMHRFGND